MGLCGCLTGAAGWALELRAESHNLLSERSQHLDLALQILDLLLNADLLLGAPAELTQVFERILERFDITLAPRSELICRDPCFFLVSTRGDVNAVDAIEDPRQLWIKRV